MTRDRRELIKDMAGALYDYVTAESGATWSNTRPGLRYEGPSYRHPSLRWRSCGAFRAWRIHAHDGTVAFSMDGYAHRSGHVTGSVCVATNSNIVFPIDDSCSDHSLHLSVTTGELVPVTDEASIEWEDRIDLMLRCFRDGSTRLKSAIQNYDEEASRKRDAERKRKLIAAEAALMP